MSLRPNSFPKGLTAKNAKTDPFASFRTNPDSSDRNAELLWFNKAMLDEMGTRHEIMAAKREERQHHFQQTNTDETQYVNDGRSMVGQYIRRVFRKRLLSIGDSIKTRLGNGIKDKSKSERFASKQKEITVTHVAQVNSKQGSVQKTVVTKSKIQKFHKTDNDMSIGQAIESALKEVVRFGRNVVEKDQVIEFSDSTEARLKFDLPRTTMRMNLNTPIVSADAQYRIGSGVMPFTGVRDPVLGDRAVVGIHRNIDEIKLGANVNYGIDSSTISYGISKQIHGPLSASVSHLDSLKTNTPSSTMVQLNVGIGL